MSNARPAAFALSAASLLDFNCTQCLAPIVAPVIVITLPSDSVTVATVALLKSTSPTGVTSSAVNPLKAVGEGASEAASAALRPGGTPSRAKLSSALGGVGLVPAVPEPVE